MTIRILHITGSLAKNGTETFIMNLYRNIDRTKIQFDFLVFTQSEEGFYKEVELMGAKIFRLPARRSGFFRYQKALDNFFKINAVNYNAVHFSTCSLTTLLPLQKAKKYNIPIRIIHSHSSKGSGLHNIILHKINKYLIKKYATIFFACSDQAAHWFYSKTSLMKKVKIIKNGIDITLFKYDLKTRNELRAKMHLTNSFVIGNVSRFSKVKNHKFLLYIFAEISKENNNSVLLLVGDGELKKNIMKLADDLNITRKIQFLGVRYDVNKLLQVMDCFIFPSLYEGVPFSILEAQATGLPVYTSDTVSKDVNLTNNVHFLSLQKSPKQWADYILNTNQNFIRTDVISLIKESGYSIKDTASEVSKIYLEK